MPLSCGPLGTLPTAIPCPDVCIGLSMSSCPAARVSFGRCSLIASCSLFKAFQVLLDSLSTVSNHHDLPHPFLAIGGPHCSGRGDLAVVLWSLQLFLTQCLSKSASLCLHRGSLPSSSAGSCSLFRAQCKCHLSREAVQGYPLRRRSPHFSFLIAVCQLPSKSQSDW